MASVFTGAYENCIDVDPLFVSSNDFHLQNNSNCIGSAIDSVLIDGIWYYCSPTDFEGNPRPNPAGSMPDIGACEHELGNPVTALDGETDQLPDKFALEQNYPNPFNPSTTIKYSIPNQTNVTIKVFDVLGCEVTTLVNEEKPAGTYEVTYDASGFSSGVYFYKLKAGNYVETKEMILLR